MDVIPDETALEIDVIAFEIAPDIAPDMDVIAPAIAPDNVEITFAIFGEMSSRNGTMYVFM
jgi:hypothetical protein